MANTKTIEWILRIAVAGEFVGHGAFALQEKAQWVGWIQKFTATDAHTAGQLLFLIGLFDMAVALIVLVKPIRVVLLWTIFWAFWTALVRPLVGESFWDFIERWANWGAPLALLLIRGWPRTIREWFT